MSALLRGTGTAAFDGLYRRHAATVYRYSLAVLGNHADAEDVTQTTFMNAYRALAQGVKPRKAENWLLTIAHNQIRQHFRRTLGKPMEVELDETLARAAEPEERSEPSVADVLRALQKLTPTQRSAIVMREFEGRSYAEMAGILGLTPSALEALLFRARRALAEQLEEALSCDKAELSLSRKLDGRLPRAEARRLKLHMRECPRCQRFDQSQRRQRKVLKGLSLMPVPASIFLFRGETAAASAGLGVTGSRRGEAPAPQRVRAPWAAQPSRARQQAVAWPEWASRRAWPPASWRRSAVVTVAAAAVVGGTGYGVNKAVHPSKTERVAAVEQTRRGARAQHVALLKQRGEKPGPAAPASQRARAATAAALARAKAKRSTRGPGNERSAAAKAKTNAANANANAKTKLVLPATTRANASGAHSATPQRDVTHAKRPVAPPAGAKAEQPRSTPPARSAEKRVARAETTTDTPSAVEPTAEPTTGKGTQTQPRAVPAGRK